MSNVRYFIFDTICVIVILNNIFFLAFFAVQGLFIFVGAAIVLNIKVFCFEHYIFDKIYTLT